MKCGRFRTVGIIGGNTSVTLWYWLIHLTLDSVDGSMVVGENMMLEIHF